MWKSTLRQAVNVAAFGLAAGVAGWMLFNMVPHENLAVATPEAAIATIAERESDGGHTPELGSANTLQGKTGDTCCPPKPDVSQEAAAGAEAPSAAGESLNAPWCGEHNLPEEECGACNPDRTATLAPGESLKLRLPSENAAAKAGVELGIPETGSADSDAGFPCRVTYDQNHMVHITPLVSGVVAEVTVDIGHRVSEGDPLIVMTSPELAELRSAYIAAQAETELAVAVYEREKGLREKGITSAQEFQEAAARLRQAQTQADSTRQRLIGLGIQDEALRAGGSENLPNVVLRAPFASTVVERHAVLGEAIERSAPVMTLANLDTMWLELSAPISQIGALKLGAPVSARFDAFEGETFEGSIDWVDSKVDEQNRCVRARAVIPNPNGLLKDGMFGKARLAAQDQEAALLVPAEAVHTYDDNSFLFVHLSDDLYDIRRVALGGRAGDRVEIREGLSPDERFVTARSFTVKSEFLKARLGAGCTDD